MIATRTPTPQKTMKKVFEISVGHYGNELIPEIFQLTRLFQNMIAFSHE